MNFISLRFSYKKGEIIRPVEAKCHTRLADPEGGRMFIEKPYKPFTDPEGGRMSTITPYDHLRGRGIFLKIVLLICDPFWVIYKNAAF
jgi:hypothetical protein